MILGEKKPYGGDVTRLGRIGARSPRSLEQELGYGTGRLASGYFVGVLAEPLRASEIRFGGLTTRSGGRDGLPLADPVADARRVAVHARLLGERHGAEFVATQQAKLAGDDRNLAGSDRIIKIFPVIRHLGKDPAKEYPVGGGSPQWTIQPHDFLIALEVSPAGLATTIPGWQASLAEDAPYDGRARVARYLAAVVPG